MLAMPQVLRSAGGRYGCSQCGRSYTHHKHLKRHMLVHTGERPYGCPWCERRYTRPDIRKRHVNKCKQRHEQNGQVPPERAVPAPPTVSQQGSQPQQHPQQLGQPGGPQDSSLPTVDIVPSLPVPPNMPQYYQLSPQVSPVSSRRSTYTGPTDFKLRSDSASSSSSLPTAPLPFMSWPPPSPGIEPHQQQAQAQHQHAQQAQHQQQQQQHQQQQAQQQHQQHAQQHHQHQQQHQHPHQQQQPGQPGQPGQPPPGPQAQPYGMSYFYYQAQRPMEPPMPPMNPPQGLPSPQASYERYDHRGYDRAGQSPEVPMPYRPSYY